MELSVYIDAQLQRNVDEPITLLGLLQRDYAIRLWMNLLKIDFNRTVCDFVR